MAAPNTIEIAGRLARRLRGGHFSKLEVAEVADVREAMNAGLQEMWRLLPARFRRSTASYTLQPPATVSCQVTAGSAALGNTPFVTADIGKSVVVGTDANWNQVAGVGALLDAYLGGNSGTVAATLYGDVVLDTTLPFDRLAGAPAIRQGQINRALAPVDPRTFYTRGGIVSWPTGFTPQVGLPRYYWVEEWSQTQNPEPRFRLRVWPAPDQTYALRVNLDLWPRRLAVADLLNATTLQAPEEMVESCLVPLMLAALTSSPGWADPAGKKAVAAAAAEARAALRAVAGTVRADGNAVLTPAGF